MPLTDSECPECGRQLHTDDFMEGNCTGCGHKLKQEKEEESSGDRPVLTQPGDDEGAAWLNTDKNDKTYLSVKIDGEYHNFYPQNTLLQWAFQATHKVNQQ